MSTPRPQPKQRFVRPRWWTRWFHRTARALYHGVEFMRVNDALEKFYQMGKEEGLRMQPPIIYSDFCPRHPGTKRQMLDGEPWLAVCWPCYMEAHVETPITSPWPIVPPPQQHTDPIVVSPPSPYVPGAAFQQFRKQLHPDAQAGPRTRKYRTINLKEMEP